MYSEVRVEAERVRADARARRDALTHEFVQQAGSRIVRRLVEQPWYQAATRVALFAAVRNEPDLDAVRKDCDRRGVRVAYPRVSGEHLGFFPVRGQEPLVPGAFRIPEPAGEEAIRLVDLDVVLTPGLAFDEAGGRLGHGLGFYDRAFRPKLPHGGPLRIGVCWDEQVLAGDQRVPTHPGDASLDAIVTERRLVLCSARLPPAAAAQTGEAS